MSQVLITIDAGHGGKDRSNRGRNGYIEADGVLKISLYLEEYLKHNGFKVRLTRRTDKFLSFKERAEIAKGSDMFISQHTDASGTQSVRGPHVIRTLTRPEDQEFGNSLADAVANEFGIKRARNTWIRSFTKSRTDWYGVIRETVKAGVERVFIIESLFHTNLEDEKLLLEDSNLQKIAKAQSQAICKEYGINWKDPHKINELYRVQVGAYKNKDNAFNMEDNLKNKKYETYVVVGEDGLIRVQTGAFSNKDNAERLERRLKADGFPTYITTNAGVKQATRPVEIPKREVRKGDRIKIKTGSRDLNSNKTFQSWVYNQNMEVHSVAGNRVVFTRPGQTGIIGVVHKDNVSI